MSDIRSVRWSVPFRATPRRDPGGRPLVIKPDRGNGRQSHREPATGIPGNYGKIPAVPTRHTIRAVFARSYSRDSSRSVAAADCANGRQTFALRTAGLAMDRFCLDQIFEKAPLALFEPARHGPAPVASGAG